MVVYVHMEPIDINATAARNDFFNLITHTQTQGKSFRIKRGKVTSAYLLSPQTYTDLVKTTTSDLQEVVKQIKAFAAKQKPGKISGSEYIIRMRDEQANEWKRA